MTWDIQRRCRSAEARTGAVLSVINRLLAAYLRDNLDEAQAINTA